MHEAQDVVLCGNPETNAKNLTFTFIKWKQQILNCAILWD